MENMEDTINTVDVESKPPKKQRKLFFTIVNVIIWLFILVLIYCIGLGLININRLQQEKKPYLLVDTNEYKKDDKHVTVYHFGPYKIVYLDNGSTGTYSLKLWFFSDITK